MKYFFFFVFFLGTSTTCFHKIKKLYGSSSSSSSKNVIEFDKMESSPLFAVKHFAGSVSYDHLDFMNKNRDSMEPTLVDLMKTSNVQFLQDLFTEKIKTKNNNDTTSTTTTTLPSSPTRSFNRSRGANTGSKNKKVGRAIALQFRAQLRDLMNRIEIANVSEKCFYFFFYIRMLRAYRVVSTGLNNSFY